MKRLLTRAVPEALCLLGLFVMSGGCSPNNGVKPGAPVLTKLTILENGSTPMDVTSDTAACAATVKGGGACFVADNVIEGVTVDKADNTCQTATFDWCRCAGDASMSAMGTWNCDPFSPLSVVIATFDRILDTDPLDPGDGAARSDIATIAVDPAPPMPVTTAVDYSSTGSDKGIVFNNFGPAFFMNFRAFGPSLQIVAEPAQPTSATVTVELSKSKVLAKDGKTQFTGQGLLADGTIKFKTAAFGATIAVPTAPPPEAGADAATSEGGADAGTDGGTLADAASDAIVDAGTLADALGADALVDVLAGDSSTGDAAASDSAAPAQPPMPGAPVPADMNMGAVTITFNNLVAGDAVTAHITVTENGKPFTDFTVDTTKAPTLTLTPKTAWAAGKLYVVTVDKATADLVGDTLGMDQTAAFVMAN